MAALSDEERRRVWAQYMRLGVSLGVMDFSKAELRAAVDAIDNFLETNATAINNAFPAAFRTKATASQKAAVVGYVAMRRAGLLRAEEDG